MSPSSSRYQSRESPETGGEREKSLLFPGISYFGAEPSFPVLAGNHHILLVQPPSGGKLSLPDHQSMGGDAETYGNVCGAGAAVEFAGLMLLAFAWKKKNSHALLGMTMTTRSQISSDRSAFCCFPVHGPFIWDRCCSVLVLRST